MKVYIKSFTRVVMMTSIMFPIQSTFTLLIIFHDPIQITFTLLIIYNELNLSCFSHRAWLGSEQTSGSEVQDYCSDRGL